MFDYSIKKQNINPKKVYAVDTGLVEVSMPKFKKEDGHKLENLVFLSLRRMTKEVYYFAGKGECDFVVQEKGSITKAVQVCYELNAENLDRELSGLLEAMKAFDLDHGTIVTLNQCDHFEKDGMLVDVVPSHEFIE